MKPHTRLDAWNLSFKLVGELYILTRSFPENEKYGIISQIRRAAISIPSNIAEGAARRSNNEFLYFLRIAYGSLSELETLLLLSNSIGYLDDLKMNQQLALLDEISKRISGLINKRASQKNENK